MRIQPFLLFSGCLTQFPSTKPTHSKKKKQMRKIPHLNSLIKHTFFSARRAHPPHLIRLRFLQAVRVWMPAAESLSEIRWALPESALVSLLQPASGLVLLYPYQVGHKPSGTLAKAARPRSCFSFEPKGSRSPPAASGSAPKGAVIRIGRWIRRCGGFMGDGLVSLWGDWCGWVGRCGGYWWKWVWAAGYREWYLIFFERK